MHEFTNRFQLFNCTGSACINLLIVSYFSLGRGRHAHIYQAFSNFAIGLGQRASIYSSFLTFLWDVVDMHKFTKRFPTFLLDLVSVHPFTHRFLLFLGMWFTCIHLRTVSNFFFGAVVKHRPPTTISKNIHFDAV